jgi:hypothetical protein
MPTYTNIIACNTANSNTGIPQCSFDFGTIEKFMLIPKGTKFTQTHVQTLFSVLNGSSVAGSAQNPTESLRGYPIGKFINIEDKSTETTTTSTGYGSMILGKKGKFYFEWEYKNGGMNYDVMLTTFEGHQDSYDVLLFDKTANAVIGTTPDDNTLGNVLQGLSLDLIICPLPKLSADGVTTHKIGLIFSDANELMQSMAYYVLPTSQKVNNIVGLRNLEFKLHTAGSAATGIVRFRVTTDGGAVDLGDTYGASLVAIAASNWVVTNNSANTVIASSNTAFSYSTTTKILTLTISTTIPTSGQEITINSPSVTALGTGGVSGFGNTSLTTTFGA